MKTDRLEELQTEYEQSHDPELRKEIHRELQNRNEYTFDLDNPPAVKHIWVDRGMVLSCENAGHPNHRVYKRR